LTARLKALPAPRIGNDVPGPARTPCRERA